MSQDPFDGIDRRNAMKAMGATGLAGIGFTEFLSRSGAQSSAENRSNSTTTSEQRDGSAEQNTTFHECIPIINGYYNGYQVWFIHTAASTEQMAAMMTEMVGYPTAYAPNNADVVDIDAIADIYAFENGVDQSDAEPWGGGVFSRQIDVLDSIPGDEEYTSLRQVNVVSWKDNADPMVLMSEEEVLEAKRAGKITIEATGNVVTAPVVRWPGRDRSMAHSQDERTNMGGVQGGQRGMAGMQGGQGKAKSSDMRGNTSDADQGHMNTSSLG